jgi:AraC-like DNA-binding protein
MAHDLFVSPFALSRVFSGTFHTNFNKYLNNTRLEYVRYLLEYTDQSITEAYENAGFGSQRTFNRAFREHFRMTPKQFREHNRMIAVNRKRPSSD